MTTSPAITDLTWGRIAVEELGEFKDVKLWPGGGRAWDWNETDTHHSPGIQAADVAELLDHGATVVVLSRGMDGVLEVSPQTIADLEAAGVAVEAHRTRDAVARYNELARSNRVGGLFHSTC